MESHGCPGTDFIPVLVPPYPWDQDIVSVFIHSASKRWGPFLWARPAPSPSGG